MNESECKWKQSEDRVNTKMKVNVEIGCERSYGNVGWYIRLTGALAARTRCLSLREWD